MQTAPASAHCSRVSSLIYGTRGTMPRSSTTGALWLPPGHRAYEPPRSLRLCSIVSIASSMEAVALARALAKARLVSLPAGVSRNWRADLDLPTGARQVGSHLPHCHLVLHAFSYPPNILRRERRVSTRWPSGRCGRSYEHNPGPTLCMDMLPYLRGSRLGLLSIVSFIWPPFASSTSISLIAWSGTSMPSLVSRSYMVGALPSVRPTPLPPRPPSTTHR